MPVSSGLKQFQTLGTIQNSSTQDELRRLQGSILSARVSSINQEGTGNDGVISVEVLTEVGSTLSNVIPNVLPLFPNYKNYPLVNEVVMVVALANSNFSNNFNRLTYYYINPINLWNSQETNPLPVPTQNVKSASQSKGYLETEAGNPNRPDSQENTTFRPGTYFVERGTVNPLYAFEGDTIIEGRFGNALRLGNTVPDNIASLNNNWSVTGSLGDPITILSNGLHPESPSYNSIVENINEDKSSIYLTSTQKIPIKVSSTNDYLSYPQIQELGAPIITTKKTDKKVVFDSGGVGNEANLKGKLANIISLLLLDPTAKVSIIGGESQVPNPTGTPIGGLAQQRINNVKKILPEGSNITFTNIKIGSTPFIPGVDNPNDIKYKEEQFVKIIVTQRIERRRSTTKPTTPTLPQEYSGEQIIINSGRLLFNSTRDHILLSSNKSINLNTVESVNIDAQTQTIIQTPELYLGGIETAQPVVLGDDLVGLLTDILSDLDTLTKSLQNQIGVPAGSPLGPTNLIAQSINAKIGGYKTRLQNSLSQTTKTV